MDGVSRRDPLRAIPPLETRLLWRDDDRSPTVDAFRAAARAAFGREPAAARP